VKFTAAVLLVGLFLPKTSAAAVLAGGRLQNVAFTAISPGFTMTVRSTKASLSKVGDIFAAGDATVDLEIDQRKQSLHCANLSIQMIDNHTTCDLAGPVKKTLVISATQKTIRSY
jgi:hypothetical protein